MEQDLEKRNRELEAEHMLLASQAAERLKSDSLYAIKLVERIVFGMLAMVALGVLGAIMALVLQ